MMLSMKRGDSFAFYINVADEGNNPLDLDSTDIRSQIRNGLEELVEELSVEKTDEVGKYKLFAASTEEWPVSDNNLENNLFMDIEMTVEGHIRSSETVRIKVEKDVTRYE